jgi:hypothetical protein
MPTRRNAAKDDGGEQPTPRAPKTGTALIRGNRFGAKAVTYVEVDGLAMFEGDIILGTIQEVADETDQIQRELSGELSAAVAITGDQFRWPNCTVPFTIDPALPNQARVTDAIAHWEANTRYRFVARTTETNFVTFQPGAGGCSSSVGMRGNQQLVNLGGTCSTGNAIHEIGHTVGLWHEQSREDRDSFVTIHLDKVQPGFEHNFDQHITDGDDIGPYDYGSIMHYPRDAFSIDGSDTITPINPASAQIGQRTALSPGDIAAVNGFCPKIKKELIKDSIKDLVRDPTLKEFSKEIIFDTKKELARDTIKELVKERIKELAKDVGKDVGFEGTNTLAEVILPGLTGPGPVETGGPLTPFAMLAGHQAPGDAVRAQMEAAVPALDAQLVALAEALQGLDAARAQLQQQYDAIDAQLKALSGGSG